ncbi:hypothetical protein AMTRI_Chr04g244790 [Amborella trichopoda]
MIEMFVCFSWNQLTNFLIYFFLFVIHDRIFCFFFFFL